MVDTFRSEVDTLEVVLSLDGLVRHVSEPMVALLQLTSNQVCGRHWQDVLVSDESSRFLLTELIVGARGCALPPLLLDKASGERCVVTGYLQAASQEDDPVLRWYPEVVCDGWRATGLGDAPDASVVAVLAVDQPAGHDEAFISEVLPTIRQQLRTIVREGDSVGRIAGNAMPLVLRDIDTDGAVDMFRALLSHLYSIIEPAGSSRARAGLARLGDYDDAISALVAANRSLMLAQFDPAMEAVRVATRDDDRRLLAYTRYSAGFFSGNPALSDSTLTQVVEPASSQKAIAPPIAPIETGIEGYVADNMEGAVDQAMFLAPLDVPVAIVGPAGTGKMYVARVIHDERAGAQGALVVIDCREFRSRAAALRRIASELRTGQGKTLVFKSPQLMDLKVQHKLAQQIATRKLADASPPSYLPDVKFVALFPEALDALVRRGELDRDLASVFAAYPIRVPPIRDRKQAVLRWAHKILGQEAEQRDRVIKGFTPDAERALLAYDWPGNISEMRLFIHNALQKTDKEWVTPVDLGLYEGIDPGRVPADLQTDSFLSLSEESGADLEPYQPSTFERVDQVLGEAVHDMLKNDLIKPLGSWLEDDLVLAVLERYRDDVPKAAAFLETSARNIRRWLPGIEERSQERTTSHLWQKPSAALRDWVRETAPPDSSPIAMMQARLMMHVQTQATALASARRARIMGVSTPTYLKRLKQWQSEQVDRQDSSRE